MKQKFGASLKNKWACLVFVVGLVITTLVSYQVETSNNKRIEEAARQSLDNAAESILTRIKLYQYGLRSARGAVLTAGEHAVNRALFHRYSLTRDTDKEFPGARGFGFIRRIHPSEQAEFVEKARADDWPEFSIRKITPNSGERYVIQYIEPVERNRAAVGLDIASEQNRYSAANSSMLTGDVRLTGPITLVQATGLPQQSFLIMLPLYRGGKTPDSSAEREKLAFGWSYAPLIMAEVLADQRLDATQVLLSLSDVTEPAQPTMFFSNSDKSDSGLYQTKQLHRIYGRVWSFNFAVTPLFIKNLQLQSPLVIALIGSLMTLLMAALTGFISVNKMNKQHLHLEQTRLAAVVASSVDGIISTTLDGQILSWNHGAEDIFGYNSEEAVGTLITHLVIPEHFLQEEAKLFQHVAQGVSISNLETVRRKKNDALVDVSVSLSPIYSLDGKVTGVSKTVRDISKQKAAEIKINELNTNLEAQVKERTADLANLNLLFKNVLAAASEFAIIATDVEGKIQLFNTGAEKLLGYTAGEIIQKHTPVMFFKAEEIELRAAALSNQYQESIVGFRVLVHTSEIQGFESSEWLNVRKDGLGVPVSLVVTSMRNEQNEVVGYLCVARDITEQRKQQAELFAAQKQLIATSEQLTLAYQVAELGIWEWDLKDNALHWNDKMYQMYEHPLTLKQEGLQYSHWESRVHPDDRAVTAARLHDAVAGTADYEPTFRLSLPSGKTRYIQAAAYVKRDEYGKSVKVIGINRDITAEHELEKSLREAKTAAEASSTAKSMFLANMSHEIRTPMNAVLGMLQLIKTTELSRQQDDYTSKAQIAAKSLLNVINDILDYSKIEAGKLELECHPFQIDDLMRELAVVLSPNLGKKNVELLFDIDTTLPDVLRGDRLRLQQILVNLAGNAIKFTETGEVVVRLQQLHIQNNNCLLRVSVTDSGIGISHEQQRIFDGFTQAEASTARKYGGSGLGLVISKQMIHLMGGELQLKSEVGKGSCFWFDLSLPIEVNPVQEDTTHYSISSDVNVLIVDDNEAALEVLAHSVEQFGATVFKARSGEEALTQFTQCMEKKQTIHAVLMDYRMPGMNGLNAAREIKNRGGIEQVPVIVMVTAFGREEIIHAQQAEDKVFESYLTKPVTAKQLYSLLKRAIAGDEMALSTRILPTQSKLRLQGIHLLLVEDNEFNRLVATELLQNEGATVDVAIGGQEGVDAVLSGVTEYDLVLMDVQMPSIDGLEATKRIRAKSGFAQLPIIAMTANVYLSDQEACLQAGMNAHLGKPLDSEKIIECILHFTKPTSASVLQQPNVIATIKDDTGADHKTLESILKRFGGNATFFKRLLTSFETNFEQQLLSLQDAVDKKDWDALLALLHTLKGTSGTAGLSSLYQMVCELETGFKLAHARTDARCETLSIGLVSNLRQLAMSELSDIHRLLATLPEESAATPLVVSTEKLNLKLTQLKRYLKAGNLKAIDMAQDLKVILQGNGSVQEELQMMSDAVEALDFETAIVQLTSLMEKL